MGVSLKFTGKCQGCRYADLSLNELRFEDLSGDFVMWDVSCSHESVCDMWDDRLSEEKQRSI